MNQIEFSRRLDEATSDLGVLIQNRFAYLNNRILELEKALENSVSLSQIMKLLQTNKPCEMSDWAHEEGAHCEICIENGFREDLADEIKLLKRNKQ